MVFDLELIQARIAIIEQNTARLAEIPQADFDEFVRYHLDDFRSFIADAWRMVQRDQALGADKDKGAIVWLCRSHPKKWSNTDVQLGRVGKLKKSALKSNVGWPGNWRAGPLLC